MFEDNRDGIIECVNYLNKIQTILQEYIQSDDFNKIVSYIKEYDSEKYSIFNIAFDIKQFYKKISVRFVYSLNTTGMQYEGDTNWYTGISLIDDFYWAIRQTNIFNTFWTDLYNRLLELGLPCSQITMGEIEEIHTDINKWFVGEDYKLPCRISYDNAIMYME